MTDTKNTFTDSIRSSLRFAFPDYPVEFSFIPDEPGTIGVEVFNVRPADFDSVQDFVFDLEPLILESAGMKLLPLVVDASSTRKFYPEKELGVDASQWNAGNGEAVNTLPLCCSLPLIGKNAVDTEET